MAIRDRVRRALHKSASSGSISQAESSNTITTTTSSNTGASSETSSTREPGSLRKHNSTMFGRSFTWGHREKDHRSEREKEIEKEQKKRMKTKKPPMHPRDKPLTAINLRHQEMLSTFTMTFGSSQASSRLSFIDGVSPCCTRPGSFDYGSSGADSDGPASRDSLAGSPTDLASP